MFKKEKMTKLKMYASKKVAYKFHVENVYVENQTYWHEIKNYSLSS